MISSTESYLPENTREINRQSLREITLRLSMELMLITGIRVGELTSIKLRDIDLENQRIKINGKGQRERFVFVTDFSVKQLINQYLSLGKRLSVETEYLSVTSRLTKAMPQYIRSNVHKLRKRVGIEQIITPHMYRHSAATLILESGVDIRFVQRLLGHQSISTTEIYTHIDNKVLEKTVDSVVTRFQSRVPYTGCEWTPRRRRSFGPIEWQCPATV